MSGADFAISGSSGESFECWEYAQANEEEVSFEREVPFASSQNMASRSLQERVIQNHTQTHTYSLIDNVVRVKTLSDQSRAEKANFWKSRQTEMLGLGTVGLGGVATALLFGVSAVSPAFWVVLGVSSLATSVLGFVRASQASSQVNDWQLDLPVAIAVQRKLSFEEGLISIMMSDDRGSSHPRNYSELLTTTELQGLYQGYFFNLAQAFERGGDAKNQLQLIAEVATHSPLSPQVFNYGKIFPHHLQNLAFYINESDKFVKAFNTIEKRRVEQENHVYSVANQQIATINDQEEAALAVVEATFQAYKARADIHLEEALNGFIEGMSDEEYQSQVRADYEADIRGARQLRDLGKAGVSYPFEARRDNVRGQRDGFIREIRNDRDTALLPFFNHVRLLHINAYRTLIGQPPSAYPTLSNPYNLSFQPPVFSYPQPSAPSYEAVFGGIQDQHHVDSRVYNEFMRAYREQQAS